ncbi:MAG: cyclase family protein [Rubrobacter sp.]|nr:cyclase family protein [Rubrobacter sp.]
MEILDITATVSPEVASWPGTEAPSRSWLSRTESGDPNTVSEWKLNSHTGTHMDARKHFIPGGWGMEEMALDRSVGPCRVVDLTHVEGHISRADLEGAEIAGEARVLFKTRNSGTGLMKRQGFEEGYTAISAGAAEYLVEAGVSTVGIDYLSVEPFEDERFRTHHTLLGEDLVILEGLLLEGVEPGPYFLVCLPLKLAGSDGSPARAILLREPG